MSSIYVSGIQDIFTRRKSANFQLRLQNKYMLFQNYFPEFKVDYRVIPGHENWQIETAGWNWAGFFTEGLETRWQRFWQFLNDS